MEKTNYFLCANPFSAKVVEPNIVQIKGHNFTGVYPSPVLIKLDARNVSICHVCLSNLKIRMFSQVSQIFTVIQKEWLTTNGQTAIPNNFEEYYILVE